MTPVERVLARCATTEPGSCWTWTGGTTRGYGRIRIGAGRFYVHRVAYEALVGPIPEGMQLDHLCRNRSCVNPEHLEPVTCRTNLMRGDTKAAHYAARAECPHGHAYDKANTYLRPGGGRACRACRREYERRRRAAH